jgi:hypothetical protein
VGGLANTQTKNKKCLFVCSVYEFMSAYCIIKEWDGDQNYRKLNGASQQKSNQGSNADLKTKTYKSIAATILDLNPIFNL